jgi:integrase
MRPGLAGMLILREELVMSSGSALLVDAAGRRRSPATMPGYLAGRAPRNKGMHYPPDPPRAEEIVVVMRQAGHDRHGLRIRALIAVLWRGGLRISEALALNETDIDERRGSLLIRHGKGDKRREAGMDQFGFEQLAAWLTVRVSMPPGALFCVIDGSTRGRRWAATAARAELRELASEAGVRRRFAPHQLRHAHAVELAREGVAVNIIQRQLGHTDLGTTSTYLQGIDPSEIIDAVRSRRPPTISATAGRSQATAAAPRTPPARAAAKRRPPVRRRCSSHRRCCLLNFGLACCLRG